MKDLIVSEIIFPGKLDIDKAEELLEEASVFHKVDTLNWPSYPYKPDVKFKIAYCKDQILLKYYVSETYIRAVETKINGDVYKDSCVEFFISPKKDSYYYNFEFSCIGTPHVGYGQSAKNRILLDPSQIKKIKIRSSIGDQSFEEIKGGHHWELMVMIPLGTMIYDEGLELNGLNVNANFYKCGDETTLPHFVSWNPVISNQPSFHQANYFGRLSFE